MLVWLVLLGSNRKVNVVVDTCGVGRFGKVPGNHAHHLSGIFCGNVDPVSPPSMPQDEETLEC